VCSQQHQSPQYLEIKTADAAAAATAATAEVRPQVSPKATEDLNPQKYRSFRVP
jgi:hypothetical protein